MNKLESALSQIGSPLRLRKLIQELLATDITIHAALLTGIHGWVVATKASDETVNNSAVLQNDDELLFAVAANEIWEFEFWLRVNSSAVADIKIAVTAPTGSSAFFAKMGDVVTAEKTNGQAISLSCGGVNEHTKIRGLVVNGATAGNVQLQWAQDTAEVSNTSVLLQSHGIAKRLS